MTFDLPLAVDLVGVFFFAGGGILRDIIANDAPKVFDPQDLYAIPALIGATLANGLWHLGWLNLATGTVSAVAVFSLRMLSLRYGWRAPLAFRSWAPRLPRRR